MTIVTEIKKPESLRYTVLKWTVERGALARLYRKLRKDNPAMARLAWERNKRFETELVGALNNAFLRSN